MSSEKNKTRERILKSTWTLLEKGGANAVRMSDIAKAAKVSRQAVYLHFPNRAELLVATTRYLDEVHEIDERLKISRAATTGEERLEAWIEAWGNYIPLVYGVAKALMAMKDSDEEANLAWNDRMSAMREGCAAAIKALKADKNLTSNLREKEATDLLWTLLSIRTWEHLRHDCGWSQTQYIKHIKQVAEQTLMKEAKL